MSSSRRRSCAKQRKQREIPQSNDDTFLYLVGANIPGSHPIPHMKTISRILLTCLMAIFLTETAFCLSLSSADVTDSEFEISHCPGFTENDYGVVVFPGTINYQFHLRDFVPPELLEGDKP